MYFPGDPLLGADPIFNCTADESARACAWSPSSTGRRTVPGYALGYRFDMVLSGRDATPMEAGRGLVATTSQTVGPFYLDRARLAGAERAGGRAVSRASG